MSMMCAREATPIPKAPQCSECGQTMRLERSAPTTPYANLDEVTYVCDCGQSLDKLVARVD